MDHVDFLIIGAGVVGLAVAAEISGRFAGSSVIVMERHETFGQETSSRNSEVIHADTFYQAAKSYLPFLEYEDLQPDMAGIRPKLQGPGQPWRDFVIRHEADRGLPGSINLLGIESPGLTCCLSIGRLVADIVQID